MLSASPALTLTSVLEYITLMFLFLPQIFDLIIITTIMIVANNKTNATNIRIHIFQLFCCMIIVCGAGFSVVLWSFGSQHVKGQQPEEQLKKQNFKNKKYEEK